MLGDRLQLIRIRVALFELGEQSCSNSFGLLVELEVDLDLLKIASFDGLLDHVSDVEEVVGHFGRELHVTGQELDQLKLVHLRGEVHLFVVLQLRLLADGLSFFHESRFDFGAVVVSLDLSLLTWFRSFISQIVSEAL